MEKLQEAIACRHEGRPPTEPYLHSDDPPSPSAPAAAVVRPRPQQSPFPVSPIISWDSPPPPPAPRNPHLVPTSFPLVFPPFSTCGPPWLAPLGPGGQRPCQWRGLVLGPTRSVSPRGAGGPPDPVTASDDSGNPPEPGPRLLRRRRCRVPRSNTAHGSLQGSRRGHGYRAEARFLLAVRLRRT